MRSPEITEKAERLQDRLVRLRQNIFGIAEEFHNHRVRGKRLPPGQGQLLHDYQRSIIERLESFGSGIAECAAKDCSTLFIRIRRQRYCSESCSRQVRSKVWYARHTKDKRRKLREAYHRRRNLLEEVTQWDLYRSA